MKTAEEIVRALAQREPVKVDTGPRETYSACGLACGAWAWGTPVDPLPHTMDCPYRMAREWVEAQERIAERIRNNPHCPYQPRHAADCECRGEAGDR